MPFRSHVCSVRLPPQSVCGQALLRAFSKSHLFQFLASSVSLRTSPFACLFDVTSVSFACHHSQSEDKPYACHFEVMSVPFPCLLSLSVDNPLLVPFRSLFHLLASLVSLRTSPFACLFEVTFVPFACLLCQSEDKHPCVPFRGHVCSVRSPPQSV